MALVISNGIINGCERDGHSMISCAECMVGVERCPEIKMFHNAERSIDRAYEYTKTRVDTTSQYEQVAVDIAQLVNDKQRQYGDSFGNAHHILEVLYPDGIQPEQLKDALVIVRVVDKLFRLSRGDQGVESAWDDIMGYALLAATRNRRETGML